MCPLPCSIMHWPVFNPYDTANAFCKHCGTANFSLIFTHPGFSKGGRYYYYCVIGKIMHWPVLDLNPPSFWVYKRLLLVLLQGWIGIKEKTANKTLSMVLGTCQVSSEWHLSEARGWARRLTSPMSYSSHVSKRLKAVIRLPRAQSSARASWGRAAAACYLCL